MEDTDLKQRILPLRDPADAPEEERVLSNFQLMAEAHPLLFREGIFCDIDPVHEHGKRTVPKKVFSRITRACPKVGRSPRVHGTRERAHQLLYRIAVRFAPCVVGVNDALRNPSSLGKMRQVECGAVACLDMDDIAVLSLQGSDDSAGITVYPGNISRGDDGPDLLTGEAVLDVRNERYNNIVDAIAGFTYKLAYEILDAAALIPAVGQYHDTWIRYWRAPRIH